MSIKPLTQTYDKQINGVISSFDRIIITGILPGACYPEGMTSFLYRHKIRIFDYKNFVQSLRDRIVANAEQIAKDNNLEIEYIRKKNFRKENHIANIIKERGNHPGLVHIFSALEPCPAFKSWHNKKTHRNYLIYDSGKCLHYYFYFIHQHLGLCYIRVPTWAPFRLQFYFNAHNLLASKLRKNDIKYTLIDNVFTDISAFNKAQQIADSFNSHIKKLHKNLDYFANKFCPVLKTFNVTYHWSIMQCEYATDIVFKKPEYLKDLYENIARTAIHTVKPENIATFLSRKLNGNFQQNIGNNFNTRIHGTRIKHSMGSVSIKMYDKLGLVLRIETTSNDVSFFKHYRKVEQRDGTQTLKYASMKKGIYQILKAPCC